MTPPQEFIANPGRAQLGLHGRAPETNATYNAGVSRGDVYPGLVGIRTPSSTGAMAGLKCWAEPTSGLCPQWAWATKALTTTCPDT